MALKKKKLAKGRLDKFYHLAKSVGFRSRAAFKLVQLNKKYNFFENARAVLDLCAAPGGWLQVASRQMPQQQNNVIIGVDLFPIRPIPNVITLTEDITTPKCRSEIKKALKTWKVDVVLHDGAPNMGTNWEHDAYNQNELTLAALKLGTEFLQAGGWFVTKVFRSPDYNHLLWVFNQLFKKVEATKPQASRLVSAEIFVVCQGYKAPKKIDAKLLDPRFVFKEFEQDEADKKITMGTLFGTDHTDVRKRQGYQSGITMLFKAIPIMEFINAKSAVTCLATNNKLVFDEESKFLLKHPKTTPELLAACDDLKVLGKKDFKLLLKWRERMLEFIENKNNPIGAKEEEEPAELNSEEEEEKLTEELNELNKRRLQKQKRQKKRANELKRKAIRKLELGMAHKGDFIEQRPDGAFEATEIKDSDTLEKLLETEIGMDGGHFTDSEDERERKQFELKQNLLMEVGMDDTYDRDYEGEEEEDIPLLETEANLEYLYNRYLTQVARSRKERPEDPSHKSKLPSLDEDPLTGKRIYDDDDENFIDEINEDEILGSEDERPLVVADGETMASKNKRLAKEWFKQDLFEDIDTDMKKRQDFYSLPKTPSTLPPKMKSEEDEDDASDSENEGNGTRASGKGNKKKRKQLKTQGFEEAPIERDVEIDDDFSEPESSEDEEMVGPGKRKLSKDERLTRRATTLALGARTIRKKSRLQMEDDLFNRYTFNDTDLPLWFVDEENKHNVPSLPITKEEVLKIKQKWKEINSRPVKKIAEAKARRRNRANKIAQSARDKANAIVNSTEFSSTEKAASVKKLLKNINNKVYKRPQKKLLVVTKKNRQTMPTGGVKLVEPRKKKELRAAQRRKSNGKGKGRGMGTGRALRKKK
eukprot:TRINITY_DN3682_c0_g2_i1.p1 TRINITY_DN3682_c0_g2~~TRINITY_DN3682_c0_g2_i1.p1  ORF type:complete len:874 (-),score=260.74 TRINITY_DN3682_c0_g2_i1:28-2649(-)